MQSVGEHPVPVGPLAVRWLAYELEPPRAGAVGQARLALENAGAAPWRSLPGPRGVHLSYHWLDERGNAILWDGVRTPLPTAVEPGARAEVEAVVRAPLPPGRYRIAFDLVDELRCWFAEVGNAPLAFDATVGARIERRLGVVVREPTEDTLEALRAQEEPLVDDEPAAVGHLVGGCLPAPDWSRRVLDAHAEGYAVVGGSFVPAGGLVERRRAGARLAPWAPGGGRNPSFAHPLLCPSVVAGVEPDWVEDVAGLPAIAPPREEPWLYDARISLTARPRSGRRRG